MNSNKNYKNFLEFSDDVFPKEKLLVDPFLSRYYRPFSLRISWLIYRTAITPNFITFLQIIIGLTACFAIAIYPEKNIFILGIIFLHFAYLLDCSDGEIARAKKMNSLEGLFLDKFAHAITMPSIFMAVSIHYSQYFFNFQFFLLLISFLSSLCSFNPVNRLVTSIVQQLITKKQYMQYDLNKYKKNSSFDDQSDDMQLMGNRNFKIKKKLFKFFKEFFRHVTYLFLITIFLLLELIGIPINFLVTFWILLLVLVITKEFFYLYLVIFRNLIIKRYSLLLSNIEFDSQKKDLLNS